MHLPIIIDIRATKVEDSIYDAFMDGMQKDPRTLPILILYGTEGLQHWDRHSHAPDYYLRHEELQILREQASSMADAIANNSAIVGLGSGSLDKINILLGAFEAQKKNVTYYALDLSHAELEWTLRTLPIELWKHVQCAALHGTFEDGLAWMKSDAEQLGRPHCALFLGSTIGNFSRENAANFIRSMAEATCSTDIQSSILISIDSCKLPTKVLRAYTADVVVPFTLAGLQYASTIVQAASSNVEGHIMDVFKSEDWYYLSEYNPVMGRHEASYTPRDHDIQLGAPLDHITVKRGENIRFAYSHKYDAGERKELFDKAGVVAINSWADPRCDLGFYLLRPASDLAS
ncbi:4-dimethylallyltryptophan N-methyltransferase [Penicillium ucsense]|uniref:4-dimethylallyltryptophan N-methyltransferase n=1 Tax=Penicillium ucsense TaxID=2839758 RepID=A0A8J8W064_9EURO|nr:4-dimethylallyltryptophan N-methyltransferase [Penicillium ucsense]KAF7730781.1 4-dimethylallyltryptophan N-methyltransferase [Penicillium ucsense]